MKGRFRSFRAFWRMPGSRGFGILLIIFLLVMVGSTSVLATWYVDPVTGKGVRWAEAFYAVFSMLTFETVLPFPRQWYTALVFFVIPLLLIATLR